MTFEVVLQFVKSFCVLFFVTFVFSKLSIVRKHLTTQPAQMRDKLVLALLFGALGCVGSGIGIEFKGALLNTRVIGVAVGGLLGGPLVGILSGAIAAFHRIFLVEAGPATAVICGISMIAEGAFAGFFSRYAGRFKRLWQLSILTVIFCELFRKLMLFLFVRPFDLAIAIVHGLTLPMIVINSLGVALFITFIENVAEEQDELRARQSEIVLAMTEKIAGCLRQGLIAQNLGDVIKTIEENTDFSHVLIANESSPIAANQPEFAAAMAAYPISSLDRCFGSGERHAKFAHDGVHYIAAPLRDDAETAGYLLLGKKNPPTISDYKLTEGLGKLFSTQLTLGNLDYRSNLLRDAEIKVLQTQVSPHFLFNSLTVISSLCRSDPAKARSLIDHLAEFYRKNLKINHRFVHLQDEIGHIEAYLEIIKARYASKIDIHYDIDKQIDCYLPPLSLQPLVENSIKHGLLPKRGGGSISIRAHRDAAAGAVRIEVEDDGKGFDLTQPQNDSSNYIGLKNVQKRLRNCFGDDLTWSIDTKPDAGTKITIVVPAFSSV